VTICTYAGLLVYFIILLKIAINHETYSVLSTTIKRNMAFDTSKIYLTRENFDFAIKLEYNDDPVIKENLD